MKASMLRRWMCVVSLSVLLLFWLAQVITRDGTLTSARRADLRGYMRVGPGNMGQEQFLNLHCNQCALVSSSGQMLGAGAGEEIDRLGCVIRMNNAPTRGYEQDIGSRTSIRVVSHTSVPLLIKNEQFYFQQQADTTYVFWGPDRNMRQDGKGHIFNALLRMAIKYPQVGIYVVTRERIQYCDSVFQNETGKNRMKTGAFLSTGFFTMILALDMCDSISVYGMIGPNHCSYTNHSLVPYHYYEQKQVDECRMYKFHEHTQRGGHRFITEKAIFGKWTTQYKIEFKHPSWSL